MQKKIIYKFGFLEDFRGGIETLLAGELENKDVGKRMAPCCVLPRQKNSQRYS